MINPPGLPPLLSLRHPRTGSSWRNSHRRGSGKEPPLRRSVCKIFAYRYMQVFRLSVSVLFSHLYTCIRNICPSIPVLFAFLYRAIALPVSVLFAHLYPHHSPIYIHIIFSIYAHIIRRTVSVLFAHLYSCYSPPLYMLFAYPYTRRYLLYAGTQTPHAKKNTKRVSLGCEAIPCREGQRWRSAGRGAAEVADRASAGQGGGVPGGHGSLPLAPSYLRPRGWRYRRWCAPPAGAWQTPERSAPAPAPAPSPWPAQAGGGGKMMKRRRRKVRRSTAYSRLPGAPGLTGPSCSSSAKGRQSLRARLGGR